MFSYEKTYTYIYSAAQYSKKIDCEITYKDVFDYNLSCYKITLMIS